MLMNLREEIKKLSDAEKILLAEDIWDDLASKNYSSLSIAKQLEIQKRLENIKQGNATFTDWETVKEKAKKMINGL